MGAEKKAGVTTGNGNGLISKKLAFAEPKSRNSKESEVFFAGMQ